LRKFFILRPFAGDRQTTEKRAPDWIGFRRTFEAPIRILCCPGTFWIDFGSGRRVFQETVEDAKVFPPDGAQEYIRPQL
jgi:hypothetical protein